MSSKKSLIIILLLSSLLAFVTGGQTFYNSCIFVSVILSLNYGLVKNNIKKIDSNFVINREIHEVSDQVKFKYILVNKSIIPVYLAKINLILSKEFGILSSQVEDVSFKSNEIIELRRSFICEKRGYYEIGKLELSVSDLFGFFTKKRILDKSIYIKVYPKIVEIKNIETQVGGFLGNIRSSKSANDDFTNIRSIREYQIGDNPKNIHFKLSARMGKNYVKQFYASNYLDLIVLVDGFSNLEKNNSTEEKCISVSLSISKYILENLGELQYILNSKSNLNSKLKDISSFTNLIEDLVASSFEGDIELKDCLGNICRNIEKTSNFIIICRTIDESTHEKLKDMKKNNNISIYLVDYIEEKESKLILEDLEISGISIHYIYDLNQL